MTTVLKAIRELDKRAGTARPPTASVIAEERRLRRLRWLPIALMPIVLAVGAVGGVLLLKAREWSLRAPGHDQARAPVVEAQVALTEPSGVGGAATDTAREQTPWGRVEKKPPLSAEEVARPVAPGTRAAPQPARPGSEPGAQEEIRPEPREKVRVQPAREARPANPAVEAGVQPARETRPAKPAVKTRVQPARDARPAKPAVKARARPAAPDAQRGGVSSAVGGSTVRVTSIAYSPDMSLRAVTLRIGDARPVTLHEGESASGVEVQLILRDAVYIRQGGNVVALRAPP